MATRRFIALLLLLVAAACGDRTAPAPTPEQSDEPARPAGSEVASDDPLADLTRPAIPEPSAANALDDYLADCVATLMLEGNEALATAAITKRVLALLEREELLGRGRPEGVVRDLVLRMKEDIDAFRPPEPMKRELDDARRRMLRLLGKSYADDLRRLLSPKGAGGRHEGSLRKVPTLPPERLQPDHEALFFQRLGGFVFDKSRKEIPAEIAALDGRKVAIAGFLMPVAEFDRIREFLLVDSIWTCCFGEAPAINKVLIVKLAPGMEGIPYYQDPILVHGVLDVGVEEDEGWVTSIYRLEARSVEPLPTR